MELFNVKNASLDELTAFFEELGDRPYRARQLYRWIYRQGAVSFDQMTDFGKPLREKLAARAEMPRIVLDREQVSSDGTRKYLFLLPDGETVETVWIPEADRATLCISTQVGCAMGCGFCLTARGGLRRNLAAWEIVEQFLEVRRLAPSDPPILNMVMMGMGEPLANLGAVIPALDRLVDREGISLPARRMTVSTVGLVPQMAELGKRAPYVNLAISLGGATDEVRRQLIPVVADKWPLDTLFEACRNYPLLPRRSILFEYLLIKGLNDSRADAKELVRRVHGVRCKVNLMTMNPIPGAPYERPDEDTALAFQKVLRDSGLRTFLRKSRGPDILAACGQLRRGADAAAGPHLNLAVNQHPQ
ncbi:MAG: 23S rRNA (adenine(2503)-C(2))-methyltransferase RlmN [Leptospirillia bacterium]